MARTRMRWPAVAYDNLMMAGGDWWQLDIGEEAKVGPTCHRK